MSNEKELIELLKNNDLSDKAKKILSNLTARDAQALRMRLGIDLNDNNSLEEVGQQFNVTREKIRAIEEKALRKLRKNNGDEPDAAEAFNKSFKFTLASKTPGLRRTNLH